MSRTRIWAPLATAGIAALLGSVALRPIVAGARQSESAPVQRAVSISMTPTERLRTPKAHWGIYQLAEYAYSPSGKVTVTRKRELLVEEDMGIGSGGNHTNVRLKTGEYEIQVQPDNSRQIVKRFIVNNIGAGFVPLAFIIKPVEDETERAKTEFVRIGPPLTDLEERVEALERKAGIPRKVVP